MAKSYPLLFFVAITGCQTLPGENPPIPDEIEAPVSQPVGTDDGTCETFENSCVCKSKQTEPFRYWIVCQSPPAVDPYPYPVCNCWRTHGPDGSDFAKGYEIKQWDGTTCEPTMWDKFCGE
jgi:hypothetical protein